MRTSSLCKVALASLVLLPFLPTISVYAVAALAKIKGCNVGDEEVCIAKAISVSRALVEMDAQKAGLGLLIVLFIALIWLALCYLSVRLGWKRTVSRMLVGLFVTVIFAGFPYFAALPAAGSFVEPQCRPDGGGFGICGHFEGAIGGAPHIFSIQVWVSVIGLPLGIVAYLLYTVMILSAREPASAR
jgi:hypothetical protein